MMYELDDTNIYINKKSQPRLLNARRGDVKLAVLLDLYLSISISEIQ